MIEASSTLVGAVLGACLGAGLLLVILRLPPLRRPTLEARLAPYLGKSPRQSRLLNADFGPVGLWDALRSGTAPTRLKRGGFLLDRVLGGEKALTRRLGRAGRTTSASDFRAEQIVWGSAALALALAVTSVLLSAGWWRSVPSAVALCVLSVMGGAVLCDVRLSRQISARERRMLAELPTVAELLALAVAAGEGAGAALERVARACRGELSGELERALAATRTGTPLVSALEGVAERVGVAPVTRFLDGVIIALERGTPLADVLRAQAIDVREAAKRTLLEAGGRKEIAMMVPVIFVVLPVTIVFALFPGYYGLTLFT